MKSSRNANSEARDKQSNWKKGHNGGKPEITASDRKRLEMKQDKYPEPYGFSSMCVKKDGVWRQIHG